MQHRDYTDIYAQFLTGFADTRKPLTIVADCSNGTTGMVWRALSLPNITVHLINEEPDGNFPAHGPNPLAEGAADQIAAAVRKHGANLGVIFDADGDRAVFIDNTGRTLPSYVIAHLLFDDHKPPYVLDLPTYYIMKFIKYERMRDIRASQVGTRFIKTTMKQCGASTAAEYSGHYYFSDFFFSDSAILAVIKILNALSHLPQSLAEFYDSLPTVQIANFDIQLNKDSTEVLKELETAFGDKAQGKDYLDGLVLEFSDWWFLARASNTEPLLRIFLAARNKQDIEQNTVRLRSIIENV